MRLLDIDISSWPNWKKYMIACAVLLIIAAVAVVWVWSHHSPSPSVTMESQQQAQSIGGVQQAADKADVDITSGQAVEAAQIVQQSANKPPVATVATTGANMQTALADTAQKNHADFQVITDRVKEDTVPVRPEPDQPVSLNVYNVQAYPQHLIEATAYTDGGDVAYLTRVKVFNHTGYVGPAVSYLNSRIRVGVRLTIPF